MIGGYLIALLVARNTPLRKLHPRRRLRAGGHRARRLEPALVLAVQLRFRPGQPGRCSISASSPSRSSGSARDADRALWAVIVSIVWKVLGFGMLLFVAAIQAIPGEIDEAAMVDGAGLLAARAPDHPAAHRAHHPARHAGQRHRLAARLRPVLPDDRRAAVQQDGASVFWIYLNSFPYLKLGYGAALSLILAVDRAGLHGRADDADPAEPGVSADAQDAPLSAEYALPGTRMPGARVEHAARRESRTRLSARRASAWRSAPSCWRRWSSRSSASLKTTEEAAAIPPTYFTARAQPRQLPAAVELSGGPADLSLQQRRRGAADDPVLPAC